MMSLAVSVMRFRYSLLGFSRETRNVPSALDILEEPQALKERVRAAAPKFGSLLTRQLRTLLTRQLRALLPGDFRTLLSGDFRTLLSGNL